MSKVLDVYRNGSDPIVFQFELRDSTTGQLKPNATNVKAKFLQRGVKSDVSADVQEISDGFYQVSFLPSDGNLYFYVGGDGCQDSTVMYCVRGYGFDFDWAFNDAATVRIQSGANLPASGK